MRHLATAVLLLALATPAMAQAPRVTGGQEPGALAGTAYVPSTHTPGCGGILCDGNDPRVAAAPPKPCAAIICGDVPFTASDARRLQDEQARAAAAASPAPPPAAPAKRMRRAKAKAHAPKTVATRTPAPAEPAQ